MDMFTNSCNQTLWFKTQAIYIILNTWTTIINVSKINTELASGTINVVRTHGVKWEVSTSGEVQGETGGSAVRVGQVWWNARCLFYSTGEHRDGWRHLPTLKWLFEVHSSKCNVIILKWVYFLICMNFVQQLHIRIYFIILDADIIAVALFRRFVNSIKIHL